MRHALISILALALCGCATSLASIRSKPVQETVVSPRSFAEIEQCIRASQPGDRTVQAYDVDGAREVSVTQEAAGIVMLFRMARTAAGTEITFQRKGGLVNYDDQARACYGGKT